MEYHGADLGVGRSGQSGGGPSVEQRHEYIMGEMGLLGTQDLRKASRRQHGNGVQKTRTAQETQREGTAQKEGAGTTNGYYFLVFRNPSL